MFGGSGDTCLYIPSGSIPKTVKRPAPATERKHHVVGGDGPATSMLGVGDGVADDVGDEVLEHRAGLLVHESGQALDPSAASEATDGGARYPLDVVAQNLAVALGPSLAEAFAAFALSKHRDHCVSGFCARVWVYMGGVLNVSHPI